MRILLCYIISLPMRILLLNHISAYENITFQIISLTMRIYFLHIQNNNVRCVKVYCQTLKLYNLEWYNLPRMAAVIAATGEITDETPRQFLEFVQENVNQARLHAVVFLNSPGGKVAASMELGREFRRLGAAAIVARFDPNAGGRGVSSFVGARCLSACVYALIGAKKRVIPPESLVGIHRMFAYVDSVDATGDAGASAL